MSRAPKGWSQTTLGQLGDYLNGRGFKKTEWRSSGRPIIRIQNLTGSSSEFNYFQGDALDQHIAHPGDLLVSWAATLGAYFWNGPEAVVNQHIFKVESRIDKRFHKYLLDSKLNELMSQTHGSGMVHITRSKFDHIPVWLPPVDEQRRIVAVLEEHLSDLDDGERALDRAKRRLIGLREQRILFAITGRGTVDLHAPVIDPAGTHDGDLPSLPLGWEWRRLGDAAEVVGGVTKDTKKQSDPALPEVPYLRVANVQRGRLDLNSIATIRVPEARAKALVLRPGDVLLNEGGDRDKLARGWVWEGQIDGCIHQNHVFRARMTEPRLDPYFLSLTTNSLGASWAERNGKQSVNLASISLSMIKKMPVIVPPHGVAVRVVREIREEGESFDRLQMSIDEAAARSSRLQRALLAAAFSGRLSGDASDIDVIEELAEEESA